MVGLRLLRRARGATGLRVLAIVGVLSGVSALALMAPYRGAKPNVLVQVLSDTVLVERAGASFLPVSGTTVLQPGDSLRTDEHGRAVVTYADGTTVLVAEGSEFQYVVSETSLGEIVVTMLQSAGRMWYRFARVLSPGSRYELRFPVGAAVVRAGTAFDASVEADGTTTIVTSDGSVDVVAAGVTVPVNSNHRTVVRQGSAPAAPSSATPEPPPSASPTPQPSATSSAGATQTTPPTYAPPTSTPAPRPTATPTPTPTPTTSLPLPSILPTPTPSASATPTATATPSLTLPIPTVPVPTPTLPSVP